MKPFVWGVLRQLVDGEFHSGAALAQALDVSRASVWNAVRELEAMGLAVYKVHGRGYRLPGPVSLLDATSIERHLGDAAPRFSLHVLETASSTNAVMLERAAKGAVNGAVIAAEWQSAGRGRAGRTWHAGIGGGLAFSLLWRFTQGAGALSGLSLAVGIALVRGLNATGKGRFGLKWPNDVIAGDRKLGGILIELSGDMLGPSTAVIGVGLNVRLADRVRAAIDQPATDIESIIEAPVDRNALLATLLVELDSALSRFALEGFAPLRTEWEKYHAHQGKTVTMLLPDGRSERGKVRGVAEDGALVLDMRAGPKRFRSGEVSLRADSRHG